jgi:hypothetical protein
VKSAADSWLIELTVTSLCFSSWTIREKKKKKTLFKGGRGSVNKICALTAEKESFKN